MELKKCYEKYVAEFGNEKWSHIDYSDSEACQDFYNRIQDFIEFSFIHLTRSILSGEYIREEEKARIEAAENEESAANEEAAVKAEEKVKEPFSKGKDSEKSAPIQQELEATQYKEKK